MIQDDRILDVRVMFRVCRCIHPEFDYMGGLVIVQVEVWKNGVCAVVIETAVSMEYTVVEVTPNG